MAFHLIALVTRHLIYEYCRLGKLQDALKLWNKMMSKGLKPDALAYNFMIYGCIANGALVKAFELHNDMLISGVNQIGLHTMPFFMELVSWLAQKNVSVTSLQT